MTLPGHTCTVCGSPDLIAIAPGTEDQSAADLFVLTRGEPSRAWCAAHWPYRSVCAAVTA